MTNELDIMTSMTRFYAVNTYGISISRIACLTSVKVVHGKRRVTRDFVQTLPVAHRLLDGILIIKDFIPCKFKLIFFFLFSFTEWTWRFQTISDIRFPIPYLWRWVRLRWPGTDLRIYCWIFDCTRGWRSRCLLFLRPRRDRRKYDSSAELVCFEY